MIKKEKIQKWIANPKTPIRRNGATQEEVAKLKLLLERAGMGVSMFYNRTTYVGFDQWEMNGITRCMEEYVEMVNDDANGGGENKEPLILRMKSPQDFRQMLLERNLWCDFTNYMQLLGMSPKTTKSRFYENSFAPWEMQGVESMMMNA
jgi:hypothetical protein